jgi:hypothetical protein
VVTLSSSLEVAVAQRPRLSACSEEVKMTKQGACEVSMTVVWMETPERDGTKRCTTGPRASLAMINQPNHKPSPKPEAWMTRRTDCCYIYDIRRPPNYELLAQVPLATHVLAHLPSNIWVGGKIVLRA